MVMFSPFFCGTTRDFRAKPGPNCWERKENNNMRPHHLIGRLLMVALTVFLIIMLFRRGQGLVPQLEGTVRTLGIILFGLYLYDVALLILRASQGRLFLMKGITLIIALLTPGLVMLYLNLPPGELSFPLLKFTLSILLLYYSIINVQRIEITPMNILLKVSPSPMKVFPLPTVQVKEMEEDRIVLLIDKTYEFNKSSFFSGQWQRLQQMVNGDAA